MYSLMKWSNTCKYGPLNNIYVVVMCYDVTIAYDHKELVSVTKRRNDPLKWTSKQRCQFSGQLSFALSVMQCSIACSVQLRSIKNMTHLK